MGRKESQTDAAFLDALATLSRVRRCAEQILIELRSDRDPQAIAREAWEITQVSRATTEQLADLRNGWVAAGKPELRRILEQKELFKDY